MDLQHELVWEKKRFYFLCIITEKNVNSNFTSV